MKNYVLAFICGAIYSVGLLSLVMWIGMTLQPNPQITTQLTQMEQKMDKTNSFLYGK